MTIEQKVEELLQAGKVKEAITLLTKIDNSYISTDITLASGRYFRNEKDRGLLSQSQYTIEWNRIVAAIRHIVERESRSLQREYTNLIAPEIEIPQQPEPQMPQSPQDIPKTAELLESKISVFIKNCSRVQANAKTLAIAHLKKLMDYKIQAATKAGFDLSKRQLTVLFNEFETIKTDGENAKLDTKEDFAAAVNKYLEETTPSWKNLKSAYDLCRTKGFDSTGAFERTLKDKPNSDLPKYELCDAIAAFLNNMN